MPVGYKGDIFDLLLNSGRAPELVVVVGPDRFGFQQDMWRVKVLPNVLGWRHIDNPFQSLAESVQQMPGREPTRWVMFRRLEPNRRGMSDREIDQLIDEVAHAAVSKQLRSLALMGVRPRIGRNNQQPIAQRVQRTWRAAEALEAQHNITITLVDMSDDFISAPRLLLNADTD
jgi:hypothetical protein